MRHMNSTTCILGSVDLMFAMQRAGQCKRDKMHAGVRLLLLGMSPTNKCSLSNVSSVTMLFVAYLNAFWLVIFLPGKPKEANSKSTRCQCQAMIRLLRTDDEGWHIDKYTRELVSQLRQNNVNLSKVYSIIATFFGRVENVPFTKRCLRTLCGKLSREQADDDVRKTMAIFSEMKAQDSEFTYNVQVDDESRIRTLMWTNGRSKTQYHHFGDVITFDPTYKTNLYDMPFGLFVGVNNHFQSVLYA
uniref:Protein FAR1-RELATED SEQUENCE n=1 Tax=Triticum urartu TaxID=4572 RepID=A0A8R7QKU7_TRIUA